MSTTPEKLFRMFTEVGIIHQLASAAMRQNLPKPLSEAQFQVLVHLSRVPNVNSPTGMTTAFQVTKGTMTHTLKLLQKNGFVRIRHNSQDGRKKSVHMTSEGEKILIKTITELRPNFEMLADKMSHDDLDTLLDILPTVRAIMDKARD
ncbi:MAG TPA: MarR family transcriptional regulator [Hellea balneolensis]|uniref:MarR family transcriptional regulator n=1 Tax=Hellea balneolensis TaxID=287478 RepID=A0A7C3C5K2_9PROT|nr:MarR family transcriptional regulator [Hellea balneolensis]